MALKRKTRRTVLLVAALALLVAAAAFDGYQLRRVHALNRAMENGAVVEWAEPLPVEALFAKAYYLDRKGDYQTALDLYRRVIALGDPAQQAAAEFNSGNIYLRQGRELRRAETRQQALPLLELAKEAYRHVLRNDSAHWDAKYNLERAVRLAPEPEEDELVESAAPRHRERAPGTVRAFNFGLP
ncbi:MAG: MxaK protein [Gammaproteobacteria bacterium]